MGEWKDGDRIGKGVHTWPNGAKYEGDFVVDNKQGMGKYTWADGRVYEGHFLYDK